MLLFPENRLEVVESPECGEDDDSFQYSKKSKRNDTYPTDRSSQLIITQMMHVFVDMAQGSYSSTKGPWWWKN